jgi:hypothetical protein
VLDIPHLFENLSHNSVCEHGTGHGGGDNPVSAEAGGEPAVKKSRQEDR